MDSSIDMSKSQKPKAKKLKLVETLTISNDDYESINIQKPFIKWAGGKRDILSSIVTKFPIEINNYREIFLGGGSVLFALLCLNKAGKIKIKGNIYAYDINEVLINTYKSIQSNRIELFNELDKLKKKYHSLTGETINRKPKTIEESETSRESYYYWIRDKFNNSKKDTIETSAMFIFLNKTCFRGIYREGPNGFNVPFGHYKNTPTMLSLDDLNEIYDLIKDVNFIIADYRISIPSCKPNDYVYLDPPYAPENKTSFVGYTSGGFSVDMHNELFSLTKKIPGKFTMSNSNVDLVTSNFQGFNIDEIEVRRRCNSKKPQSKTTEVIIYN